MANGGEAATSSISSLTSLTPHSDQWKILNEIKPYTITQGREPDKIVKDQIKAYESMEDWLILETGVSGKLKFSQRADELYLFENSNLQKKINEYHLANGIVRFVFETSRNLDFSTPVAHLHFEGKELILKYDNETGLAEAFLLDGKGWIKGIYREEEMILKSNHRGAFQGILEKGEPSFDLMLKGKKVARGDLLPRSDLTQEQIQELKSKYYIENQKIIVKPKPKPKPGQICSEPFAKLNECLWSCSGSKCVRKRCFANGEWGDAMNVKLDGKNKTLNKVAPCDY